MFLQRGGKFGKTINRHQGIGLAADKNGYLYSPLLPLVIGILAVLPVGKKGLAANFINVKKKQG
mgnify:CR=1 FL=1